MEENYFIYYYFPKYDYCISNIYSATTKEFFDNFYSQTDDFTYSGWLNNLQSVSYGTSKVTEDNTGEKYIDFMFSSKAEQNLSRSDYCCVIRLAYSKIDSILSHYLSLKTGNVYILDRNNNQIYSNISYDNITLSDYNVYRKTLVSQSNKENNDYLANAIMTGDFSIAKNLLATMKSNMQSESNDNVFNILTQVLSAFYSLNSRLDKNSYEKLTSMTLNLMNLAGSIEPQQISDLVENACEICKNNTINTTESPSPPNIILKIKIYIEENYKNENLNVSSVGDYFDVTPYYLSSLFKKSEGQSILEFINQDKDRTFTSSFKIWYDCCKYSKRSRVFKRTFVYTPVHKTYGLFPYSIQINC